MRSLLVLTLFLGVSLQAATVRYSGSVGLDDGQIFYIDSSVDTAEQYVSTTHETSQDYETDWDVTIPEPYVCTRSVGFKGPHFTLVVRDAKGKNVLNLSEKIEYSVAFSESNATDYVCPKWNVIDGHKGHLMLHASGARMLEIGKYGNSPLWIAIPSLMSYEAHGQIRGKENAFKATGLRLTSDYDSKVGWLLYRPVPNEHREVELINFQVFKNGQLAGK